ncbi:MAG TPA: helix-turn-helix transcriptional regulator [Bryobacteraceae bacterium]|nr:helix-turn-helix transcriptional regulator [Bryobacteraceae bacterium]
MEDAGQKLKRARERLNLRYRDVEEASIQIAERHQNDEFVIALSRLSDIENKGTVPSIYRLYCLCAIYRLDLSEVLEWYGVDLAALGGDAATIAIERTHLIGFGGDGRGEVQIPLALDPGLDLRKTTYLSRMIQRWGKLPLSLLSGIDLKSHRYAFIGSEDWSMYPLIQPGALVLIDENRRKVVNMGWSNEFERPIYFFEHRKGYACCWCTLNENQMVLQPHPASMCYPEVYSFPDEIDVIGQVVGVAMLLDQGKRRRNRT